MISGPQLEEALRFNSHNEIPDLHHSALLVIDMQECFREIAEPITQNIQHLIKFFREQNRPLIFTQHGNRPDEGSMIVKWWDFIVEEGHPDAELMPEIKPLSGEVVIPKTRYSSFYKTNLEELLHVNRITDLVISGVMTNICCETTSRDAFMRDFRVFFLADGTATASTEMHMATLRNLGFGFAYISTCSNILQG